MLEDHNPLPSSCAWRKVLRWSIKTQSGCLISYDLCVPESLEIFAYPAHTHTHTVAINCDEWLCLRVALTWMKGKRDRCVCVQEGEDRGKPVDTDHFAAITRDVALDTWCTKKNQTHFSLSELPWSPGADLWIREWLPRHLFSVFNKGVGIGLGHAVCVCVCACEGYKLSNVCTTLFLKSNPRPAQEKHRHLHEHMWVQKLYLTIKEAHLSWFHAFELNHFPALSLPLITTALPPSITPSIPALGLLP